MPALFAVCTECSYRFQFDYDFRQSHCQRCRAPFNWERNGTNPRQEESFLSSGAYDGDVHGIRESSATDGRRLDVPKLPGE